MLGTMHHLSMLRAAAAVTVALVAPLPAAAAPDVTFTRDVAPILHARCATCHRSGEVAPMPLLTYADARPYARAIRDRVVSRRMPPWPADRSVGHFSNDPSLTAKEIDLITQWVDAGAPQGDPRDLPPLPSFPEGWQMGEPDLIVELPEVEVPARGRDIFPIPTVALDLKEDRWIRAVEIRPGNPQVSHHAVLFSGTPGPFAMAVSNVLAVWAVGTPPTVHTEGTGRWLRKGQVIFANLHYHPNGTATTDRTRIGFYFGKGDLKKEVSTAVAGNVTFSIPPGATDHELRAVYVADQDISIVSFFPHMHLRGKDMKMTATFPDGRQQVLLNVPAYDFNWQLFYYPTERIQLPRGTRVDVVAHYDNSAANRANPNPQRTVTFGETSNDEMMFGTFEFIADAGVSPLPPDDRMRVEVLLSRLPRESSFALSAPFLFGQMVSGLHLPRTGDGTWYLAVRPGIIIDVPVRNVVWKGNAFTFETEMRAGRIGSAMVVAGEVHDDGTVTGTVEAAGRRGGLVPFRTFTGRQR
jgi:hypothetical protein